ncbi:MAG: PorT family protein [Culturomica sp.]|nr:PorT family protein [Culturomica sp.]
MKKMMIVVALVAMSATAAFAQFSYGVKGGLNFSSVSNMDKLLGDNTKMKPSFYLGAFAEYKVNDFFGISPELVYSRQGLAADVEMEYLGFEEEGDVKTKYRLNYLNVTVLAKFYVLEGLSVDFGPQFGFLLSSKLYMEAGGEDETEDMKDTNKGFDLSVGLGLTYNFNQFFVQGRYNLGLTDVAKDNESDDKFRNNVIQFGVGYRF